jgi:hypothetical protein
VPWTPSPQSTALLDQVNAILDEYRAYLPLTIRQVFYRLVGAHGYEKTEKSYTRLSELMNRARRARKISMDAIRDDGGQKIEPTMWQDEQNFLDCVTRLARDFRLDRQEGQRTRLIVMCEAAGMAPQLADAVDDYCITVISSGGFNSVTENHKLSRELTQFCDDGFTEVIEILHVGDHDPSGAHLFLAMSEDVTAFVAAYDVPVTFTRLAVTPEQIEEMGLDTAPPKTSDNRAFGGETCQAEAIPPDLLADILTKAVDERTHFEVRERLLERESEIRDELIERLEGSA